MVTAPTLNLRVRPARAWVVFVRVTAALAVLIGLVGVITQVAALGGGVTPSDLREPAVAWPLALQAAATLCAIALAIGLWRRPPGAQGVLSLRAGRWHWAPSGATAGAGPVLVRPVADFGGFLLLKLRGAAPSAALTWLPLARRDLPDAWHGLRCALADPAVAHSTPPDGPDRSDRLPG